MNVVLGDCIDLLDLPGAYSIPTKTLFGEKILIESTSKSINRRLAEHRKMLKKKSLPLYYQSSAWRTPLTCRSAQESREAYPFLGRSAPLYCKSIEIELHCNCYSLVSPVPCIIKCHQPTKLLQQ